MKENYSYLGHECQVFGAKEYTLTAGAADGLKCIELYNSAGMRLTVLPGRGMDIGEFSFKGDNISFITPSGYVAPALTQPNDQWVRSFTAGFLTTCGLASVGLPSDDEGAHYSQHGIISHIPAEQVSIHNENGVVTVSGVCREAALFGYKFMLVRSISLGIDDTFFTINDKIVNFGYSEKPYMLLYHFNFGYPFIDDKAKMDINALSTVPRDDIAAAGVDSFKDFCQPIPDYSEQCFFHEMESKSGRCSAGIISNNLGLRADIEYPADPLDTLVQWKHMGAGEYVTALEPANCKVMGRAYEREHYGLKTLKPGESKECSIKVSIQRI